MSTEPLKVGDLVYIARTTCCGSHLGHAYAIETIIDFKAVHGGFFTGFKCNFCGAAVPGHVAAFGGGLVRPNHYREGTEISLLKKIPPLADLESGTDEMLLRVQPPKVKVVLER
jgi:hypothetical protein